MSGWGAYVEKQTGAPVIRVATASSATTWLAMHTPMEWASALDAAVIRSVEFMHAIEAQMPAFESSFRPVFMRIFGLFL